jgi:hypothetical protein
LDPEPESPMYDLQTLIDVPPALLKAMKWKRAIPAIMVVHFTPEYANLGHLQGLTFANGFLHSDHLELDHAPGIDSSAYRTSLPLWPIFRIWRRVSMIKKMDRWSSDAYLRYSCIVEEVLHLHASILSFKNYDI